MNLSPTQKRKLIRLCWIAYFATYLCRLNFSAVMPELSGGNIFTESQIGSISSVFFICYGVGQFVSGFLGDRFSPRLMIFAGLFISSLSNIALFFFNGYGAFLVLWAINGCVQSMVWSPMLRVAGENLDSAEQEKFSVDIAATVPLGTLASYAVSLCSLAFLPWKYVFLACGSLELLFSMVWIIGSRFINKSPDNNLSSENTKPRNKTSLGNVLKIMVSSGLCLIMLSIAIQGTLKDSVTQWIPTFLNSRFQTGASISLLLTMILPIINVTGAYFARALFRRLQNELKTSFVFFLISAVLLCLLRVSGGSVLLSLLCMAGVTNCMFAINVLLITMLPLRLGAYGCVSTIGGLLNAVAYIGCGALNIVAGFVLDKTANAWDSLFIMWFCLAAAAGIITLLCVKPYREALRRIIIENE